MLKQKRNFGQQHKTENNVVIIEISMMSEIENTGEIIR